MRRNIGIRMLNKGGKVTVQVEARAQKRRTTFNKQFNKNGRINIVTEVKLKECLFSLRSLLIPLDVFLKTNAISAEK